MMAAKEITSLREAEIMTERDEEIFGPGSITVRLTDSGGVEIECRDGQYFASGWPTPWEDMVRAAKYNGLMMIINEDGTIGVTQIH